VRGNIFLTSENEWYKAAYFNGTSYLDYPVGTNTTTVCVSPTATANRPNCNNAVGAVTNAGAYTGSASPYGTYDQGGNVGEWNESFFLGPGPNRGQRGGLWWADAVNLAASQPNFSGAVNETGWFGFRVASVVPEPGTGLLVMTGVLGLSLRRKRTAKAF